MPTILLGNTAPIQPVKVDDTTAVTRVARPDLGDVITTFTVPDHESIGQVLTIVSSVFRSHHSDAPAAWVESDDSTFADALSKEFHCPVGRPDDWVEGPQGVVEAPNDAAPSTVTAEDSGVVVTPATEGSE